MTDKWKADVPGWNMEGHGRVVVALGDRFLGMHQTVTATRTDDRLTVRLALSPSGRYVVVGVEFRGTVDEPVGAQELRVKLADVAAFAARHFTAEVRQEPDGRWAADGTVPMEIARQVTRRAPKRQLTPEFLRGEVAADLAEAARQGVPYTNYMSEKHNIARSTAANWVKALRELEGRS